MTDLLLESGDTALLEGGDDILLEGDGLGPVLVRERPPLRHTVGMETPAGRFYQWSPYERRPEDVFSDLAWSSTMPGGHEEGSCVLPRQPWMEWGDLKGFGTMHVYCAGEKVGEYRLENAPKVSGDAIAVTPAAGGWQEHMADDESATGLYLDQDLSRWQSVSRQRRIDLLTANFPPSDHSVDPDQTSGVPALTQTLDGKWVSPYKPVVESWYEGEEGGSLYYDFETAGAASGGPWTRVVGHADDELNTNGADLASLGGSASGTGTVTLGKDWIRLITWYNLTPAGADGGQYGTAWRKLKAWGPGATKRGVEPDAGVFDSDVIAHAVARWAPLLRFTEGPNGTIRTGRFVIPQAAFHDPTTAGEMVRQVARYELPDWAVWDDRTLYVQDRGSHGRVWHARVGPAQLRETGASTDRIWNGVVVQWRDVDGSTRTVGPPGFNGATSSYLEDTDTSNPANELGIRRWDLLQIQGVTTEQGAIAVGAIFLSESRLLDTSGQAQFVGHVRSDKGVWHPSSHMKAGDRAVFTDAGDTSERHIVRASHNNATFTCQVDLDAPPRGLDALLERINAVLIPLGLGN